MALVVGILTLITNIVMVIQNRKSKPKRMQTPQTVTLR